MDYYRIVGDIREVFNINEKFTNLDQHSMHECSHNTMMLSIQITEFTNQEPFHQIYQSLI